MSISLLCVSTARDSVTIPILSLRMRRFLPSICSAGTARDTSTSRRYIPSLRSICHHGFQNCRLIKTFCGRLNMLSETFKVLVETMIQSFKPKDCDSIISIVDSMPIVTCKGKNREGKVATEITSKGYCSTKNMYYYGMKLHMVGQRREGTFPFPEMITLTPASDNDLTVFKSECVPYLSGKTVLADKTYSDFSFFNESNPVKVLTPHKEIKGEPEVLKQREKAARDLFSQAVSKVRQPIESFFNWLNEKTEIQRASKVRATKGLLVHTFGKLAIALLTFVNF